MQRGAEDGILTQADSARWQWRGGRGRGGSQLLHSERPTGQNLAAILARRRGIGATSSRAGPTGSQGMKTKSPRSNACNSFFKGKKIRGQDASKSSCKAKISSFSPYRGVGKNRRPTTPMEPRKTNTVVWGRRLSARVGNYETKGETSRFFI